MAETRKLGSGRFNELPHVEHPEGEDVRAHMVAMHGMNDRSRLGTAPAEQLARIHDSEHRAPEYQSHQHAFPTKSPDLNHYGIYTVPRGSGPAGRSN